MTPSFSDVDFAQLAAWLQKRSAGMLDIVTLEGFLTAIVIGPHMISPNLWLPKVWGKGKTPFKDIDEVNRFVGLVMGLYNEIASCFEQNPAAFEPSFYERSFDDKTVIIVDEWCEGFIKGMRMDAKGWEPLKRERPDLVKPMELFGTRAGGGNSGKAANRSCARPGRCGLRRRYVTSTPFGCPTGERSSKVQRMFVDTEVYVAGYATTANSTRSTNPTDAAASLIATG